MDPIISAEKLASVAALRERNSQRAQELAQAREWLGVRSNSQSVGGAGTLSQMSESYNQMSNSGRFTGSFDEYIARELANGPMRVPGLPGQPSLATTGVDAAQSAGDVDTDELPSWIAATTEVMLAESAVRQPEPKPRAHVETAIEPNPAPASEPDTGALLTVPTRPRQVEPDLTPLDRLALDARQADEIVRVLGD